MAESLRWRGQTPSTEAHWDPLRASPERATYFWRRIFYTATGGALRSKSLCPSALAYSTTPVCGRL
eukprot:15446146-Alexandrium_andersonii.AAC.1